jgi:hypothetical protein
MDYFKVLFDNAEQLIAITTLLTLFTSLFKKLNEHDRKVREEKIFKQSKNLQLFFDRITLVLFDLIYQFILYILVSIAIIVISSYYHKVGQSDPKVVFMIVMIFQIVTSELFRPKIRKNYKAFISYLTDCNWKRLINTFIFFSPRIIINVFLLLVGFLENDNTIFIDILTIVIVFIYLILTARYFALTVKYDRYSSVIIYFKYAFSNVSCDYKNFFITDKLYIVKDNENHVKLTKYNYDMVSKIEYLGNNQIDDNYREHLFKRGFTN